MKPTAIWEVQALLGEGPAWFANEQALRFVDIKAGMLHRLDPASGERESLFVGGQPSFVIPAEGGVLLVGSRHAIHKVEGGSLGEMIATIEQPEHNRTNDATVDAQGRLWLATMDDDEARATGTVHCLADGRLQHFGGEAVVVNGPAATHDGKFLYWCDSPNRTIWRERLDGGARAGEAEVFIQLGEQDGHPDGIILDAEDCLWVALWDGWGARRYSPRGECMAHVPFPCSRVTKLAFGGPDLRTLYATTARIGLGPAQLAEQPLAGSLFSFPAPVQGRQLPSARL